jgi:hypothetical protein
MSITSKVVTAALALSVIGGVGAAGTLTANAASTKCGAVCTSYYSVALGKGYLTNVVNQAVQAGEPVNLAKATDKNPGEDFAPFDEGQVTDFYKAGIISDGLDKLYANLHVIEIQYVPAGSPSGLCVGVGSTPSAGTMVTLQDCGVTARTTWIVEPVTTSAGTTYDELFSGATASNFQHPFSLTASPKGLPAVTAPLGAAPLNYQLWGDVTGVIATS